MLEWIKDKVTPLPNPTAADALRAHFGSLENLSGAKSQIANRLTRFVLTGEDESVVADLAALNGTQSFLTGVSFISAVRVDTERGLSSLLKVLPDDPEVYLRLAKVYEATTKTALGGVISLNLSAIPAFQGSLSWLSTFLVELSRGGKQRERIFPASLLSAMISANSDDPSVLVRGAFFYEDSQGKNQTSRWLESPFTYFQCLEGFPNLVSSATEIVRPAFRQKDASSRACVLRALKALEISPDPFVEEIALLSLSGSKEVREHAAAIISNDFSLFRPLLEGYAEKGSSDERYHVVRLFARSGSDEARSFLASRLEVEKAAKVAEAIREALAGPSPEQATTEVEDYGLPQIPDVPVYAPLDKEVLVDLRSHVQEAERRTAEEFERNQFARKQGWKRTPVDPKTADRLFDALQNLDLKDRAKPFFENSRGVEYKLLHEYTIPSQFQLIHVIRWCLLLSSERTGKVGDVDQWSLGYQWRGPIISYQKIHRKQIDLRELAAVFRAIGLDDRIFGRLILRFNRYVSSPFLRSDPSSIWPYFAERLDLLEEALGVRQVTDDGPYRNFWAQDQRQNAFNILKLFPHLPGKLIPLLWDIALGAAKTERSLAQECLERFPNREEKIIGALSSRQQEARLAAAQWLAALDHKKAIPAMRLALAKEKSEVVKDELIKALEMLGVKLEELLDLDKLDQEAERGLKKGIPKDLEWFPFAQLPTVTWTDSGKPVPKEILHWFLVQGHKLNTAEANPTLRRYCSLFRKEDREKLGRFVMEAWIAQDTKPKFSADEAAALAQREAQQMAAGAKQYPQYYPNFDEQRAYQTSFNRLVIQPEGSQTGSKGILALAGACCGGDAAAIVHRYVKQWYGYRGAQCKALLQVLAWIDHPSATQVVLSVANRFRTKGIQEEALRQCQLLAMRKGWTLEELADRTVPTAGFDEGGNMELDYGPRQFKATLSETLNIVVTNQDGKTIASLPDANQSDDQEKAKQAKSALSTARKELKSVLTMQRDRLYEALCTQRAWRFEDWDTYLRQHPIVGRYCQRLVWVAYDNDKAIESFRSLADGTLTNHQDDQVKLSPETTVRLAHDETLDQDNRTAWLQHLSDYKVEPLFQQFGKQTFALPDDLKEATVIKDFLGHLVKAFSLRNRLTKLGYTRGTAQDGGWFFDYRKTFLSLGIEAVIEFTGNGLPEENRTVALQRLSFARKIDAGGPAMSEELTLGALPRVLLSECWNDMRMAAVEGSGFAADWEKQTEM